MITLPITCNQLGWILGTLFITVTTSTLAYGLTINSPIVIILSVIALGGAILAFGLWFVIFYLPDHVRCKCDK